LPVSWGEADPIARLDDDFVRRAVLAAVCGGYGFFALYLFALTGAATFRSGKGLVLIAGVWIVVIYGGYRLLLFASEHWPSSR